MQQARGEIISRASKQIHEEDTPSREVDGENELFALWIAWKSEGKRTKRRNVLVVYQRSHSEKSRSLGGQGKKIGIKQVIEEKETYCQGF